MIRVQNVEVFGWEAAIRGMRNPMNSWDRSDSMYKPVVEPPYNMVEVKYVVGKNDLDLMRRLYKAGNEHRKYLRMIHVQMDIIAPLYWWKEFDTYKIGTVSNSCSTMHKIHAEEFELKHFSWEHLGERELCHLENTIDLLNHNRKLFLETKDKEYWWNMIQSLPTNYEQRRTLDLNYENTTRR